MFTINAIIKISAWWRSGFRMCQRPPNLRCCDQNDSPAACPRTPLAGCSTSTWRALSLSATLASDTSWNRKAREVYKPVSSIGLKPASDWTDVWAVQLKRESHWFHFCLSHYSKSMDTVLSRMNAYVLLDHVWAVKVHSAAIVTVTSEGDRDWDKKPNRETYSHSVK